VLPIFDGEIKMYINKRRWRMDRKEEGERREEVMEGGQVSEVAERKW